MCRTCRTISQHLIQHFRLHIYKRALKGVSQQHYINSRVRRIRSYISDRHVYRAIYPDKLYDCINENGLFTGDILCRRHFYLPTSLLLYLLIRHPI